jgi:hypothetical protein
LYRYKSALVHYRYDFTPRVECTVAELVWGFIRDPCYANQVTEKFIKYMEENKDEFFVLKTVAVIAKLDSVIAERRVEDGKDTEAKIVLGNCLDLIPSTENYSFKL